MMSQPLNAFSCLHLKEDFDLDLQHLNTTYETLMRCAHPDQWSSALAQSVALTHASRINQSYDILKNPVTRAQHLLELSGGWPVPQDPQLLDILWTYQETGHHPQALTAEQAYAHFSSSWSLRHMAECQRAYWWIRLYY